LANTDGIGVANEYVEMTVLDEVVVGATAARFLGVVVVATTAAAVLLVVVAA
jgi:hypothetical protein